MSHADAKARQAELAKLFAATAIGVREARAKRLNTARRLMFLLSGLLTCGTCGCKYGVILKDRYGCLNHLATPERRPSGRHAMPRAHHSAPPIELWSRIVTRCAVPVDTEALLVAELEKNGTP